MFERLKSFLTLAGLSKSWQIAVYTSAGICIGMVVLLCVLPMLHHIFPMLPERV